MIKRKRFECSLIKLRERERERRQAVKCISGGYYDPNPEYIIVVLLKKNQSVSSPPVNALESNQSYFIYFFAYMGNVSGECYNMK